MQLIVTFYVASAAVYFCYKRGDTFTFSHLADDFIQSDLHLRTSWRGNKNTSAQNTKF